MTNVLVHNPFYMKVDSPTAMLVIQHERTIYRAIKKGLYEMHLNRPHMADDVYSAFLTYFVERPARDELAQQMDNVVGFLFQEAYNYTRTNCLMIYRRREYPILSGDSDDDTADFKGVNENYLPDENTLTPEEIVIELAECDEMFQYDIHIYQDDLREAGMPRRFNILAYVAACYLIGGTTEEAAEMLGISKATLENWNRKLHLIISNNPGEYKDLYSTILKLVRGVQIGWKVPIESEASVSDSYSVNY